MIEEQNSKAKMVLTLSELVREKKTTFGAFPKFKKHKSQITNTNLRLYVFVSPN